VASQLLQGIPVRPLAPAEPMPRSRARRLLYATLLWIPVVLGPIALDRALHQMINADTLTTWPLIALDSVIFIPLIPLFFLAPLASYRRRDCLVYVVLPLGVALSVIVFWRIAFLPYRDWAPRPEEVSRLQRVAVPGDDRLFFKRG
jgi:hypothetical protein